MCTNGSVSAERNDGVCETFQVSSQTVQCLALLESVNVEVWSITLRLSQSAMSAMKNTQSVPKYPFIALDGL